MSEDTQPQACSLEHYSRSVETRETASMFFIHDATSL